MILPPALLRWSRAHHHLVTRKAWLASGLSDRTFDRAARRGELIRLAPNVAALPGAPIDATTNIAAAVLSCRAPVMASHLSSGHLWGAPVVGDDPVELITTSRSALRLPGVVVHRPRDFVDLRAVIRCAVPSTNPLRTLTDVGATSPDAVATTLEAFVIERYVTPKVVRAALDRHRGRGHRGVRPLAAALDALVLGDKPPDSVLEPAMGQLFHRHRLAGWVFHPIVAGIEVDFAFPAHGVVVEVDGWSYHSTPEQFERDRERDATLVAAGWVVLRFSWTRVARQGSKVAGLVKATLAHRAVRPGTS